MATPYDGKIAVWHWKGNSVVEDSIQGLCNTLKAQAPNVKQIWVKTSDGSQWQGVYDTDRALAIDGRDSVKRWVQALEANNLEFHAWCVPKGRDVEAEADIIIQTCQIPGVRSMILDIEPYAGFWEGGRDAIRPFMTRIRRELPGDFHIAMAVDPRPRHYNSIFPDEWFPFINSVHLMAYWASFQRPPGEVVDEAFNTWRNFGRPMFVALQTNAEPVDMEAARARAVQTQGSPGLSWWRLGVIAANVWPVINTLATTQPAPQGRFGQSIVVTPDSPRFAFGTHTGQPPQQVFSSERNPKGWTTYYKTTQSSRSQVWARWDPQLTISGWYELSAFVPAKHATTVNARFKIHGVIGRGTETLSVVPQEHLSGVWTQLGVYNFDASNPTAAVVFLNDLTGENAREIAFDALRWRQIVGVTPSVPFLADGFDAPIGTPEERASGQVWPGGWFDATGFPVRYRIGTPYEAYHTGADLNLNTPYWDADAHSPVYAAASGVVTHAARLPGWGNVIIIRHDPLVTTGQVVYGRYAHVEDMRVQVGQRVTRGQRISSVGDAYGAFPYHLHFDISPTSVLQTQPFHWPKLDLDDLLANYVDPQRFIMLNRPPER